MQSGHILPLHHQLQLHPHDLAAADGLQHGQDFSQALVPELLQVAQQTRLKKHLQGGAAFTTQMRDLK